MLYNLIGKNLYKDSNPDKKTCFYILEDDNDEFNFSSNLKKIKTNICGKEYPNFCLLGKIEKVTGYIKLHYINSSNIKKDAKLIFDAALLVFQLNNGMHIICDLIGIFDTINNKKYLEFHGLYLENNDLFSKELKNKYINNKFICYIENYEFSFKSTKRKLLDVSCRMYIQYPISANKIIECYKNFMENSNPDSNKFIEYDLLTDYSENSSMDDSFKDYIKNTYTKLLSEKIKKSALSYCKKELEKYFNKIKSTHESFLKNI